MSRSITAVIPTFVLRRIDTSSILEKYKNGEFCIIKDPPTTPIKLADVEVIVAPEYGTSSHEPIFTMKDRSSRSLIVATSNCLQYETFTKTGGELVKGGLCEWCKMEFKHESVGIPIASKEEILFHPDGRVTQKPVYWVEGIFCDEECALAHLKTFMKASRDPHYLNSEVALRNMYSYKYPNTGALKPANDYRLIKERGGSIPYSEWKGKKNYYIRTTTVLIIPAKVEYLKQ